MEHRDEIENEEKPMSKEVWMQIEDTFDGLTARLRGVFKACYLQNGDWEMIDHAVESARSAARTWVKAAAAQPVTTQADIQWLSRLVEYLEETHREWGVGHDERVGDRLKWLSGTRPSYEPDMVSPKAMLDQLRAAATQEKRWPERRPDGTWEFGNEGEVECCYKASDCKVSLYALEVTEGAWVWGWSFHKDASVASYRLGSSMESIPLKDLRDSIACVDATGAIWRAATCLMRDQPLPDHVTGWLRSVLPDQITGWLRAEATAPDAPPTPCCAVTGQQDA